MVHWQQWQRSLQMVLLASLLALGCLSNGSAWAGLPQGNAVTDPQALLRLALPIDNEPMRQMQIALEDLSNQLRGKQWGAMNRDVAQASRILQQKEAEILAAIAPNAQVAAHAQLEEIGQGLSQLRDAIKAKDRAAVIDLKAKVLEQIGDLEAAMVTRFPFEVPPDYSHLPQLKGRATVLIETTKGNLTLVVDGYSAPVTAGNFVDLVQRGFYNDMPFIRAEESYVLQTGDPPGPEEGFIDPETGAYRAIPLEILVQGDREPIYGITLEAAGLYLEKPVLPFSAFGTVAMARPESDPNGGSSQFFFFLFEPDLTPAGLNLLDGRYSVFGYVVKGKEVLDKLRQGDRILKATVVNGAEYLQVPTSGAVAQS